MEKVKYNFKDEIKTIIENTVNKIDYINDDIILKTEEMNQLYEYFIENTFFIPWDDLYNNPIIKNITSLKYEGKKELCLLILKHRQYMIKEKGIGFHFNNWKRTANKFII